MKILLVEDDERTAAFIIKGLRQAGYIVEHASDGETGLALAECEQYAAAVVDIMLPRRDGLSMVEQLRRHKVLTPVIFLSAKSAVDDRIKGLQSGGDDYLPKPFAFSELLARIQALMRRAAAIAEPTSLTVADLTMDLIRRKVWRAGQEIELQAKEFALLEYLMRNNGRVVSKIMIIEHVWDYSFDPQTNIVEARICRLRDKVDRGSERKLIHTLRGIGYKIE
ncbi:MAG: response regulator transcription factor [Syntrophaceae bacterium]